ncbi:hypothetical protein SAMN05216412_101604 [Nitrosospira multiformis]|uniref:Uncharacterized protein n=1 Tax=Nitrosospira multiformis TaxID=1231 RepID=A0A1H9ZD30_9PROT|nr:hypothetical protein SAMN05216412_101604 [Nitrosospira multiformis]
MLLRVATGLGPNEIVLIGIYRGYSLHDGSLRISEGIPRAGVEDWILMLTYYTHTYPHRK